MHPTLRQTPLFRQVALCLAYAVLGWLALQIAVPPGDRKSVV